MLILAFDTTSDKGGLGVYRDQECLALVPNSGAANLYSISLFEMAELAFSQAHLQQADIELYAVANGPGSFTGIRVGLAAARAWGRAFSKPVRGVSMLEALANRPRLTSQWAFPILDARRGEFFLGAYLRKTGEIGGRLATCYEPTNVGWVLKTGDVGRFFAELLRDGAGGTCVVRAHDLPAFDLAKCLPDSLAWQQVEGTLVDTVASLALKAEEEGRADGASSLDACYIRRPDAEIGWKG